MHTNKISFLAEFCGSVKKKSSTDPFLVYILRLWQEKKKRAYVGHRFSGSIKGRLSSHAGQVLNIEYKFTESLVKKDIFCLYISLVGTLNTNFLWFLCQGTLL